MWVRHTTPYKNDSSIMFASHRVSVICNPSRRITEVSTSYRQIPSFVAHVPALIEFIFYRTKYESRLLVIPTGRSCSLLVVLQLKRFGERLRNQRGSGESNRRATEIRKASCREGNMSGRVTTSNVINGTSVIPCRQM